METTSANLRVRWIDQTPTRWFYFSGVTVIMLIAAASFGPELLDQSRNLGSGLIDPNQ
jgi:hypothetical protein